MSEKVVIIGAGIAGANAASSLAGKYDVSLINGENYPPYYRMRLEEVIAGKNEETIFIHPEAWYREKGIKLIYSKADSIDRDEKKVILSDGSSIEYDKLIISTGSDAISLPFADGLTLRTIDDAKKIRSVLLESSSPVSIIGGGLLGLELADTIATSFSLPVTVFESATYILSQQLDPESSEFLKSAMEKKGISIRTGIKLSSYESGYLIDSNNNKYEAGTIIYSVGSRPSKAIALKSGLEVSRGVTVDDSLLTSDKDIYAVGDVSELSGRCFALAMYAREMGIYASKSIEGNHESYIPSESSTILKVGGIDVSSFGSIDGNATVIEKEGSRITLFEKDGILNGVVLIGAKAMMMKAKNAISKSFDPSIFE